MTDYVLKVIFDDREEPIYLDLPGLSHEDAETFAAQVREDVLEAKNVNAPVVEEVRAGSPGTDIVFDPRHVVAIDLDTADPDVERQAPAARDGGPVELDGPIEGSTAGSPGGATGSTAESRDEPLRPA
ncbi:MAG: hypothetical protein ABJA87_07045 [bacterium]